MRLQDRVCLITNCDALMGPAFAAEFQREGARVALQCTNAERARLELDRAGVRLDADPPVWLVEADFGERGVPDREVDEIVAANGRLDVLVNNTPGSNAGLLQELDDETWDAMLRTMLTEPVLTTRAALRHMIPAGRGRIVNLTSAGGIIPWDEVPVYCALRAGMVQLTRALGKGLAPHGVYVKGDRPELGQEPDVLSRRRGSGRARRVG